MIYLDNAATTFPKPPEVYEQTLRFMKESGGNPGRGGHFFSTASAQVVEAARRKIAQLLGLADFHRVVFTYNCTDSINIVLKGFLRDADHVIATNLDHNSISRPLGHLSRTRRIQVTRVPFDGEGMVDPEDVRKALRGNTKLVVLNHGSNVLGSVQPLEPFVDLVRSRGIVLLLDAAQTVGRIGMEIGEGPVFVVCSGHKSLYGMPGIGILTIPPGIALEKWREGGTGTASESLEHPDELPMTLEAGTPNFLSIASVREGIAFIEKEGMPKIHSQEMRLALHLYEFLSSEPRFVAYSRADSGERLPIISFNLRNVPAEEVAAILDHHFGIAVRAGLHCAAVLHAQLGTSPGGCLRVSPGYFNKPEEMDTLIAALKEIAQGY